MLVQFIKHDHEVFQVIGPTVRLDYQIYVAFHHVSKHFFEDYLHYPLVYSSRVL